MNQTETTQTPSDDHIFTPLYILFFHFGPGMLAIERYDRAMMIATEKQMEAILALGEINEATLVGLMDDQSMMNGGKKIFTSKCATCHGMFGEGGIGPNLTDGFWLHGPQLMDIYRTVREGVPNKGMLAWERQLRPAELLAVSAYVGDLLDSDPPNAKPPQGEQVVRVAPEPSSETESESGDAPTDAVDTTSEDRSTEAGA
jgi:cytochrome c oxidase cbb3-type subunit 3